VIQIRGLRVVYGRTIALDSVDLEIGPGVTGLFGPNASGKTTLLRIIAGLLRPTVGSVTLSGQPIESTDEAQRRRIGYAGHDSGMYADLSISENLRLFAGLYDVAAERGNAVIANLGLTERADSPVRELSAGLRRRAAVARALVSNPELLLLDEPYANLDDEAAEIVSNAVKAWHRDDRIAVIATHGAKKVKAFADAGIILRRGRVVVAGSYRGVRPAESAT
jgi:heme ABC exporter ATP-binding subunit CcmA